MGEIVKGKCSYCFYKTEDLYLGDGFMDFNTFCDFPVLDKERKIIISKDIRQKEKICTQNSSYVFLDNEELLDKTIENNEHFIKWGEYKLYHCGYYCPKCKKYGIEFMIIGVWD
jgi:hypothetical protein